MYYGAFSELAVLTGQQERHLACKYMLQIVSGASANPSQYRTRIHVCVCFCNSVGLR